MRAMTTEERKQIELGILKYSHELCEKIRKDSEELIKYEIKKFISMRDNPEEYAKILREAERRKAHNIEALRGYGLDI